MSYRLEVLPAVGFAGLVTVLCVPGPRLLIALVILSLAALALVGVVFAVPHRLIRSVRRRRQARPATGRSRRPASGRVAATNVENRVPSGVPNSPILTASIRT